MLRLHTALFLFCLVLGLTGMLLTDLTLWAVDTWHPNETGQRWMQVRFFRNLLILSFFIGILLPVRSFYHAVWKTLLWLVPPYLLFIIFQGVVFGMEIRNPEYVFYYTNILTFTCILVFICGVSIRLIVFTSRIEKTAKAVSSVNGALVGILVGLIFTRLIPLSIVHYWILLLILLTGLAYWSLRYGNNHLNLQTHD